MAAICPVTVASSMRDGSVPLTESRMALTSAQKPRCPRP